MMANLLVAQSGGPTAAINATICGIVKRAMTSTRIDTIYGAQNGIKGVLDGRLIDIGKPLSSPEALEALARTPAAALGSCRLKMKSPEQDPASYERIIEVFRQFGIEYFVYVGGNDSMDTVLKLSQYVAQKGLNIRVMGAPKTIDNDLCATDHTPGFGSAAKYIATTFAEIKRDVMVYDYEAVTIVEVMGRNAGWLTAASSLARLSVLGAPNLIYLPEHPFDEEQFLRDIQQAHKTDKALLIAVSEGVKDAQGNYVGESSKSGAVDAFGHKYLEGVAGYLEKLVKAKLGCKARGITLNLMQRCASHLASATDIAESQMLGQTALDRALDGVSGQMAAIERLSSNPYTVRYTSVPIELAANEEKTIPASMIKNGNDVTEEMLTYLKPLVQGEVPVVWSNGVPAHFQF